VLAGAHTRLAALAVAPITPLPLSVLADCPQHEGHLPPAMGPCTAFSHRPQNGQPH